MRLLASAAGNTAWKYEFSHPLPESERGASHSGELRYIFGMFPLGPVANSERRISKDMQTYWTTTRRPATGPWKNEDLRGAFRGLWPEYLNQKFTN